MCNDSPALIIRGMEALLECGREKLVNFAGEVGDERFAFAVIIRD